MATRDWDGASYDRISAPMEALGRAVLERLSLSGDETVLDAGCGSGRVTEALIERLPHGRVIAVDASASMVAAARQRLGERADVRQADLLQLELEAPVDAVLSTATFHWIADHDRLFARLHAALRPGGRLVAQCGGEGNIANVHRVANEVAARDTFAEYLLGWRGPWNFANPAATSAALGRAGFDDVRTWLQPVPVTPDEPEEYLRTINLGAHLDRLPAELRDAFVRAVLAGLGDPVTIDYVRLNLDARAAT
jgi:trans-aconitate 2-methyltransferase